MKKVLVVGSVNMDYTVYTENFPLPGETIYGSSRFIQPGGKGENQAIAIAKSKKVICDFIGAIGDDSDGKQIKEVLSSNGVNAHLKVIKGVETGNATIVVNKSSENEIIIVAGANGALQPEDIDVELIKKADYVVIQNEISEACNAEVSSPLMPTSRFHSEAPSSSLTTTMSRSATSPNAPTWRCTPP